MRPPSSSPLAPPSHLLSSRNAETALDPCGPSCGRGAFRRYRKCAATVLGGMLSPVGFAVFLVAAVVLVWLNWRFGLRMGFEVGRYVTGALTLRSNKVQNLGWIAGFLVGCSLWLPLMIFNALAFKTPYPVTKRRLTPRRW